MEEVREIFLSYLEDEVAAFPHPSLQGVFQKSTQHREYRKYVIAGVSAALGATVLSLTGFPWW